MRKPLALLLGTLLPLLGLSGVGQAQSSVLVQGIIQSVDCQSQTIVISDTATGTSNSFFATPYTPVVVGSASIPFCALGQYIGAPASAWLTASGSELVATRIDVLGPATVQPPGVVPPPAVAVPEPVPVEVESPLPIVGIVVGTIVVGGLLYLLTHDHDHYYRYPYYGAYYHHYFRPEYRPYFGPIPALAPVITVPPVIAGPVLGTVAVGGFEYLIARDRDGRFYRYPYYGPYRQHYYRAEYRPYSGPYRDAPVREGDAHWNGAVRQVRSDPPGRAPAWQGPPPQWNPQHSTPGPQGPPRWTPPAIQTAPAPHNGPPAVAPNDPRPQWNHDPRNGAPAWQGPPPQWNPQHSTPGPQGPPPRWVQNDRRGDPPGRPQQQQSCRVQGQNQSCRSGPDR